MLWWPLRQLKSKNRDTRTGAAMPTLMAALTDAAWSRREGAAATLGQIGDARAIEPLVAALTDTERWVHLAAATALEKIDPSWANSPAAQAAMPTLVAALKDAAWSRREAAAEALGRIGDARAIEPLVAALKDADGSVQGNAAEALGRIGDARAIEPLMAALTDANTFVRRSAAEALGRIGDARAIEPLMAALKDKELNVQKAAAVALGQLGDTRVIEAVRKEETFERFGTKSRSEAVNVLFDQALPCLLVVTDEDVLRICKTLGYEIENGQRHRIGSANHLRPIITRNLERAPAHLYPGQCIIGFQVVIQSALHFAALNIVVGDAQGSPGYMYGARLWRTRDQIFVLGWEGFQLSF